MLARDLIDVDVTDLAPESSEFELDGVGALVVRKATLRDEIILKKKYGNRLEKLQKAVLDSDMSVVCEAFWQLLDYATKEKLRSVRIEDDNGNHITSKEMDHEHEILFYLSAGPFEKSLITHSIAKSLAGEKALDEIGDEKLKKKILTALKRKQTGRKFLT